MLIRFAVIKRVIEVSGPSARVDRACLDARRCQGERRSPSGTRVSLRSRVIEEVDSTNGGSGGFVECQTGTHLQIHSEMYQRINLKMVFRSRLHGHIGCGWHYWVSKDASACWTKNGTSAWRCLVLWIKSMAVLKIKLDGIVHTKMKILLSFI